MCNWFIKSYLNGEEYNQINLNSEIECTIGRSSKHSIICVELHISRNHAVMKLEENIVYIMDTNSENGVFVNNSHVLPNKWHEVNEKDVIGIGAPTYFKGINHVTIRVLKGYTPDEIIPTDSVNEVYINNSPYTSQEIKEEDVIGIGSLTNITGSNHVTNQFMKECSPDKMKQLNPSQTWSQSYGN